MKDIRVGEVLYLWGGLHQRGAEIFNNLMSALNLTTNTWITMDQYGDIPIGHYGSSLVQLNSTHLLLVGGLGAAPTYITTGATYTFNMGMTFSFIKYMLKNYLATFEWKRYFDVPDVAFSCMFMINNTLFMIAGVNDTDELPSTTAFYLGMKKMMLFLLTGIIRYNDVGIYLFNWHWICGARRTSMLGSGKHYLLVCRCKLHTRGVLRRFLCHRFR